MRRYLSEGRTLLEPLLAATDRCDHDPARAAAQSCLGYLAFFQGDYAQAGALFKECRAIQRRLRDSRAMGLSIYGLAMVAQAQGDYGCARALSEESQAAFREASDAVGGGDGVHEPRPNRIPLR